MKLPRLDVPNYDATLPVSGQKIRYRPYTVKEEKILMMASQSDQPMDKINALNQIIANCSDVDPVEAHPTDVEWIFLQIRAVSVSPVVELNYTITPENCGADEEDRHNCPREIKTGFNINTDVTVENIEEMSKHATLRTDGWVVRLSDNIGLLVKLRSAKAEDSALYEMVESIFDGDQIFAKSDFSLEEFNEFIDDLPTPNTKILKDFLDAIPYTQTRVVAVCHKCKKEFPYKATGVISFLV